MPRQMDSDKVKIIIESFLRNKGHYRKMSEELTAKYGTGYSISMISNIMNSTYVNEVTTAKEKELIQMIMIMNSNNLGNNLSKANNQYYSLSKEQQKSVITQLYLNGRTMEQIATVLGISKATVSRVLMSVKKDDDCFKAGKIEEIKINNKTNNDGNFRK